MAPPSAGKQGSDVARQGDKPHTILETIELSDESDDEFNYEELPEDPELLEQDDEEQLDDINRLFSSHQFRSKDAAEEAGLAKVQQRPQVIDDFFRNFLLKYEMKRSLEVFQAEWYEMQQTGKFKDRQ
eukprot:s2766_g1.t1